MCRISRATAAKKWARLCQSTCAVPNSRTYISLTRPVVLKRVAGPLLPHVVRGNATELRIDQRDQLLFRRGVALAQLRDERRHAASRLSL